MGAGAIGSSDERIRLAFRDHVGLLLPSGDASFEPEPIHTALLEHLEVRGASFWTDLTMATQAAALPYDDPTVLVARGRPRPGRLARLGPPAAAGRWSLVAPLLRPVPTATEAAHARALQLLERYGVLTREAALGEGAEGGFAGVYPVLKALEERGQVRRGYFVAGLGAAQFAVPGAVDRLRAARESPDEAPLVLAATDPAQPYGAAIPWPSSEGRPARAAGALVVLVDGAALAYLERGGHRLVRFPAAADDHRWAGALADLVERGRFRSLELRTVDGSSVAEGPPEVRPALEQAGFQQAYRGWTRRPHKT